jgi:hypothetical protein
MISFKILLSKSSLIETDENINIVSSETLSLPTTLILLTFSDKEYVVSKDK